MPPVDLLTIYYPEQAANFQKLQGIVSLWTVEAVVVLADEVQSG